MANEDRLIRYEAHMLQSTLGHQVPWVPTKPAADVPADRRCLHCGAQVHSETFTVWTAGSGWQRVRQNVCRGTKKAGKAAPGGRGQLVKHSWRDVLENLGADYRPADAPDVRRSAPPSAPPEEHQEPHSAIEAEEDPAPMSDTLAPATAAAPLSRQPEQPTAPVAPRTQSAEPSAAHDAPRQYSPELKAECRRLVREEGLSTLEAGERLGLPQPVVASICSWPRKPGASTGGRRAPAQTSTEKPKAPPPTKATKAPPVQHSDEAKARVAHLVLDEGRTPSDASDATGIPLPAVQAIVWHEKRRRERVAPVGDSTGSAEETPRVSPATETVVAREFTAEAETAAVRFGAQVAAVPRACIGMMDQLLGRLQALPVASDAPSPPLAPSPQLPAQSGRHALTAAARNLMDVDLRTFLALPDETQAAIRQLLCLLRSEAA